MTPAILSGAGLAVERHGDHFRPDCPDEEWLAEIGRRGWVGVTHDQQIRYKVNERDAVIRHGVPLLVAVGKATPPDLARSFVATRRKIERFLLRTPAPLIARSIAPARRSQNDAAPGRVERWYPG